MKPNNGIPPIDWDYPAWLRFLGAPQSKYDPARDVFSSLAGELSRTEIPPYQLLPSVVVDELRRLVKESDRRRRSN